MPSFSKVSGDLWAKTKLCASEGKRWPGMQAVAGFPVREPSVEEEMVRSAILANGAVIGENYLCAFSIFMPTDIGA